jgi:hypothetical protein
MDSDDAGPPVNLNAFVEFVGLKVQHARRLFEKYKDLDDLVDRTEVRRRRLFAFLPAACLLARARHGTVRYDRPPRKFRFASTHVAPSCARCAWRYAVRLRPFQNLDREEFSKEFSYLPPMQERRLKRHIDSTAMGYGGFGIWGADRRKHPDGANRKRAFNFREYLLSIPGQ